MIHPSDSKWTSPGEELIQDASGRTRRRAVFDEEEGDEEDDSDDESDSGLDEGDDRSSDEEDEEIESAEEENGEPENKRRKQVRGHPKNR